MRFSGFISSSLLAVLLSLSSFACGDVSRLSAIDVHAERLQDDRVSATVFVKCTEVSGTSCRDRWCVDVIWLSFPSDEPPASAYDTRASETLGRTTSCLDEHLPDNHIGITSVTSPAPVVKSRLVRIRVVPTDGADIFEPNDFKSP